VHILLREWKSVSGNQLVLMLMLMPDVFHRVLKSKIIDAIPQPGGCHNREKERDNKHHPEGRRGIEMPIKKENGRHYLGGPRHIQQGTRETPSIHRSPTHPQRRGPRPSALRWR
jgi:hypothetical protein